MRSYQLVCPTKPSLLVTTSSSSSYDAVETAKQQSEARRRSGRRRGVAVPYFEALCKPILMSRGAAVREELHIHHHTRILIWSGLWLQVQSRIFIYLALSPPSLRDSMSYDLTSKLYLRDTKTFQWKHMYVLFLYYGLYFTLPSQKCGVFWTEEWNSAWRKARPTTLFLGWQLYCICRLWPTDAWAWVWIGECPVRVLI